MNDIINNLWGEGDQLNALQMGIRAFLMFLIALLFIRLSGKRAFAKKSPFDNVIVIMLGAVLARGVVGASPFFSTVAAAAMMMMIHRPWSDIRTIVNMTDAMLFSPWRSASSCNNLTPPGPIRLTTSTAASSSPAPAINAAQLRRTTRRPIMPHPSTRYTFPSNCASKS